jgi:hypothetical protein
VTSAELGAVARAVSTPGESRVEWPRACIEKATCRIPWSMLAGLCASPRVFSLVVLPESDQRTCSTARSAASSGSSNAWPLVSPGHTPVVQMRAARFTLISIPVPELERELDRLYGLPLDEFTAARNELARRLKADGNADDATQVRALARPSVPVWTINQLSRREPDTVRALLDAGSALRKEQERLLKGSGTADSLRAARAKEREAVHRLTERARAVLEDVGRPATAAMLERITETLEAAAVDDEGRRSLKAGRLTGELKPGGFDVFGGLQLPARKPSPTPHDELAQRRQAKEDRARQRRELEQKARELERAARGAEREAERAAEAAADASRLAEIARAAADEAAAELAEL